MLSVKALDNESCRIYLTQFDSVRITAQMDTTLSEIGAELVAASKEIERKPGEILQEIFPFVFEASVE